MPELAQNTEEWLKMRKDKIGSSDAPIIMGISPWRTPYQLWQEKLSLTESQIQNKAMSRGHQLEPKALSLVEQLTGLLLSPMIKFHTQHSWMMASLDAIDVEQKHIVEIKSPGQKDHQIAVSGQVPEKYFPQLQHQIEVCGVEFAFYFSFDGEDGILLKVYRDDKYIKNLISKEEQFYEYMQELVSPPLTQKDYQEINSSHWNSVTDEWKSISSQISRLEEREKTLRETIISMCQDKNSKGNGINVSKSLRRGLVDYKKIPEISHVNLDFYRKEPIICWKIIKN
jgi:putative phage-type endonuclease